MPATEMTTAEVLGVYQRLAIAVGEKHWQEAVERQEEAIRLNLFLGDYLRSEYAIAYQLDRLRTLLAKLGTVPHEVCNDPTIFPSMGFAAQVLEVMRRSTPKQAKAFVKHVRAALSSPKDMHGLRLELEAATHFVRRGQRVAWHRVNTGGTFDLLIPDLGPVGLEVECKSISADKGRRIHRLDALAFWGELWRDLGSIAKNLRSGLAVVLTVPYRLPADAAERTSLAKEIVARIVAGNGASLGGGAEVRVESFDPAQVGTSKGKGRKEWITAIHAVTRTANREAAVLETPAGGMLALVLQSAIEDDVLNQIFDTLDDSASRQFTSKRGALFWVALQGINAKQLLSIHEQDVDAGKQPSGLKLGVNNFLHRAPSHIVGVVFCSRSGLFNEVDGSTDSGGATNFFLNENSPLWHSSFRDPLRTAVTT